MEKNSNNSIDGQERRKKYKYDGELLNHVLNRGRVLRCIEQGFTDSKILINKTTKSKSSIDRDKRLLRSSGYIKNTGNQDELTPLGKIATKIFKLADVVGHNKDTLGNIPEEIPLGLILNSKLVKSGGVDTQEPIKEMRKLMKQASEIKVYFPAIINSVMELLFKQSLSEKVELTTTPNVMQKLQEDSLDSCFLKKCRISVVTDPDVVPYNIGLTLLDQSLTCLTIFSEQLRLLGVLISNRKIDLLWVESEFNQIRGNTLDNT